MDQSDTERAVTRRGVLRAGAGATAGLVLAQASSPVAAQNDAYGGYLSEEGTWGGVTTDGTGRTAVTVDVGAEGNGNFFAFSPAALVVDPGTTVRWRWTGDGGGHNVVSEDEVFNSGDPVTEAGAEFEYTFGDDETGVYQYFCNPHKSSQMKGVVVVGEENVETETEPLLTSPQPSLGGFMDNANDFGGVEDFRGADEVRVAVGAGDGISFDPPALHVDDGTTVVWEWTGEGGRHNVVAENGEFDSGEPVSEEGTTFEHTFEAVGEEGSASENVHNYVCEPHEQAGMLGSVVVGDNYPTGDTAPAPFRVGAVWGGAAAFGLVSFLGLVGYRELTEDHE